MMDAELLNIAQESLRRALGLAEDEGGTAALTEALAAAEEEICRYLNRDSLPKYAERLLVELAALKYLRTGGAGAGKKSESYSEGQLSQSESYLSPEELSAGEGALLRTLAPYRRVRCGRGADR